MVILEFGQALQMGFYKLKINPHFERASRAFHQHLLCHILKDNEIMVIAQRSKEIMNFC